MSCSSALSSFRSDALATRGGATRLPAKMVRGDATAREYPKLQNGSSTRGLEGADPETREAVLALRGDWKFYAVFSFCHTFRAVMRLPVFTADRLERALLDPAREGGVIELILRLIEDGSRTVRLEVNDWERRLKRRVRQIAHETDYFEDAYPDPETESDEDAGDGEEEDAGDGEEEQKANDEEKIPSDPPVLGTGDRDAATVSEDGVGDEAVAVNEDDDDPALDVAAAPCPRGYPLRGRKTFFDIAPSERLDVLNALCEHCLESDEACVDEVAAMAAAHAAVSGDAYQCHPEAHGERVGVDAESRAYFASGDDARLWRWERPAGSGGHRASGANSQKDPGFGTVCADARECRALALHLEASASAKDQALLRYLRETHLPLHDAAEAKTARAARLEAARLEDLERRRAMKASYDEMDRKRSGRIAVKIAEDAERRRLREEAEEAEAEAVGIAKARDAATHRSRVRWMLLPPRLRPVEVPEGMDAAAGPGSRCAPGEAAAAAAEDTAEDPPGAETVGRYVRVLWADDGAWYDAIVTKFANDRHTLRYLADDTVETLDLRAERKVWCPAEDYVTPAGAPIPPPAREPAGLDERGVKSGEDASGSTVLFIRRPKRREEAGATRAVGADAVGALDWDPNPEAAPGAAGTGAADDSGERKRHACRVCLRNGVVGEDHFKFGKRCPFHPQHVKPSDGEREERNVDPDEGADGHAKQEARASGSVREGRAVAVASAPPSAAFSPETETPPPSSETDERPTGAVASAPGSRTAASVVSSAAS